MFNKFILHNLATIAILQKKERDKKNVRKTKKSSKK